MPFYTKVILSTVRLPAWTRDISVLQIHPLWFPALCVPQEANLHGLRSSPGSMAIASVRKGHEQEVSGSEDSEVRVIFLCSLPSIEGLRSCQAALSFPTSLLGSGNFTPSRILRHRVVNDHCSLLVWELSLVIAFNPAHSISSSFIMNYLLAVHLHIHVVSCWDPD